jgi:hypothetical protein
MKTSKRIRPSEPKAAKQKRESKKQLIKIMLLSGKTPLRAELDDKLFITNSPELISQLRKEGMPIAMDRVPKKKEPGWQGRYRYVPPQKVDRIKTRAYMNQA